MCMQCLERPEEGSSLLELELQRVESFYVAAGNKTISPSRAAGALNHMTISPAPALTNFLLYLIIKLIFFCHRYVFGKHTAYSGMYVGCLEKHPRSVCIFLLETIIAYL